MLSRCTIASGQHCAPLRSLPARRLPSVGPELHVPVCVAGVDLVPLLVEEEGCHICKRSPTGSESRQSISRTPDWQWGLEAATSWFKPQGHQQHPPAAVTE